MRILVLAGLITACAIFDVLLAAPSEIEALITGDKIAAQLAADVLQSQPPDSLVEWIREFSDFPIPDTTGWAIELFHPINDTLIAPAWLYIPINYDPHKPTPFVMSLHGGVSGAKFRDASAKNWLDEPVIQIAEEEGWLVLYPLGMNGCAWWDPTGMENLLWFVRDVKRRFNVDDDRVAMCGFSDGGSGSYSFAMLAPTDFAVFFPWSGHPSVGTQVGGIQSYPGNAQNRPLFASNGGKDQLYPADKIIPYHEMMLNSGAFLNTFYCDTAGHNYGYMPHEWSQMADRLRRHGRDPFPPSIFFETADLEFGAVDWLKITSLDTVREAAPWHTEFNLKETDDRITIGFNPDPEYTGKGLRIGYVSPDPETPASKSGMKIGDILIQIDDIKITGMADISKAKAGRKRGDKISLMFKRGKEKIKFDTNYPPAQEFVAFPRTNKSGAVRVRRVGNTFQLQASRVGEIEILLSPGMVRIQEPVKVVTAGSEKFIEIFDSIVIPDSKILLSQFLINHDRQRLVYSRLKLRLP